ncbi:MAG: PAS domain S-box protein [Deltaproteobacteria bacterium]|nr:PAS domain S-box protein [Deltaproteobacteria bacterium]
MRNLVLEKRFINFYESLSFPIVVFDTDKQTINANGVFLERYGLKKEDILRKRCHHIFFNSNNPCPPANCQWDLLFSVKMPVRRTVKSVRPDGSVIHEDLVFSPVLNDSGEVDYIVATVEDITRSKHMEADLKKTNEFLENIINSSVNAIVVADMRGEIILMNDSARKLFGLEGETRPKKIFASKRYPPGEAKIIMEKLRGPRFGGIGKLNPIETNVLDETGREIPVEMTASIVYQDGREAATMAIFKDLRPGIEEEKKRESARMQLVQSDKLASIGRLAAGVAHEINNPLAGIFMYANLALEEIHEDNDVYENLQKVLAQAERCKKIVRGLLDFSRRHEPQIETLNMNDIIEEIVSLVANQTLFRNIKIQKELDADLRPMQGDKSQLQQVFINFTLNAAEAMEGKGHLIIKTSVRNGLIEIKFTDTGSGIRPEHKERIFEPFFTTKSEKNGTGLGLSVSYGIITRHGGAVSVKSRVNSGTTFTLSFPVAGE